MGRLLKAALLTPAQNKPIEKAGYSFCRKVHKSGYLSLMSVKVSEISHTVSASGVTQECWVTGILTHIYSYCSNVPYLKSVALLGGGVRFRHQKLLISF